MYKSPIETVMKEVFQKMNEDFENSVLKAVQKVGINVDKEELQAIYTVCFENTVNKKKSF